MKTKVIEYDRNGLLITQSLLDLLYGEMVTAQAEGYEGVDIIIRRLPVNRPTRLVMDYDFYEILQEIAKEYRATRALKESHGNTSIRS